jgi:hypothetical protein
VSNSQSPRELSLSEFVEAYVRRIAQLPGCDKVVFDPVNGAIRFEYQGQVQFARPQTAYAQYKKDISRLEALLDAHINSIRFMQTEIPRSFAAVAPSLMPMVRDRRYLDLALLMGRISGPRVLELSEIAAFPFREISGELVLTLVRDSADSTSLVSETDLKQWGVSFDQASEVAMKNLRARTELRMEELVPGLYGSQWHDTYDATRMLLTDLLCKLPLSGDLVVAAPTRTHLLVAGSDNPAALAAMISTAVQLLETDPKPLSADVLQFSGNRWAESRLRNAPDLANARRKLLQRDYAQQKGLLDKLHQAEGTDLFVASYRLAKDEGNGEPLVNVAQLTEGVVTLLPEADYLMLMTRARETLIVTWADADAVIGVMLKKLNLHPPRYLAETFPNPQQLDSLRTKVVKFTKAGRTQPPRGSAQSVPPGQDGVVADGLAAQALESAEIFRKSVRDQLKVELGYDLEGVRWLDDYVEHLHQRKVEVADNQVQAVGAFLGECIIRNFGGTWSTHDNMEMVRFDASNGVFPFNKVRKHWSSGREGGDSLLGMYEAVAAMRGHPLGQSGKPRTEGRTLEEIRKLPEGLRVTHSPNPVSAVMGKDEGQPFAWEYSTTVEARHAELNIVEFGAFVLSNGNWRFATAAGRPFSAQEFAEWYSCTDGVLKPGKPAADPKNWSRRKILRSSRCIWYYIGKDAEGKLFRGEAELEERGTLVPPHSEAPATKGPGSLASVARMFGKASAESLLRFDGLYRAKLQPKNDADLNYCYLRLYSDKTALYNTSAQNPSELTKWFNVKSGKVAQGDYKLSGDTIRIEIRATNITLVFSGTVDKNRLLLDSKRFTNSPAVRDEFLFMGWWP